MPRRHHLTGRYRIQGQDILDDRSLVLVNDLFAEAEAHKAIDIFNADFLFLFVLARPMFRQREAEPDDARPAENLRYIKERDRY